MCISSFFIVTMLETAHNRVSPLVARRLQILWPVAAPGSIKTSNTELFYSSARVFSSPGAKLISLENWLHHSAPHSPILSGCLSKFSRYCSALSTNPISYRKQMELSLILACHLCGGVEGGKRSGSNEFYGDCDLGE